MCIRDRPRWTRCPAAGSGWASASPGRRCPKAGTGCASTRRWAAPGSTSISSGWRCAATGSNTQASTTPCRCQTGQVDRDVLAHRVDGELERPTWPVWQRQGVVLACVFDPVAAQRHPDDIDVLPGAAQRRVEAHPVPAFGHLRPGDADAQPEPAAGQRVQRGRRHRGQGGTATGNLEDGRADVDPLGLGCHPGQHGGRVRAVRLGGPDDGVAEPVGLPGQLEIVGVVSGAPVAQVQSDLHTGQRSDPVRPSPRGAVASGPSDRRLRERAVQQRHLGRSGLIVSRLALGTMTWGRETDVDDAAAQLAAFRDAGGTLVDTADVYAGGDSERVLSRLLAGGDRDEVLVATKAHSPTGPGPMGRGSSRGHLLAGKYRGGTPADSRARSEVLAGFVAPYLAAWAVGVVDAVLTAADGLGASPVAVALAWVRDRPGVVAPVVGARTAAQLADSLASEALELPAEIRAALDDVSAPEMSYPERMPGWDSDDLEF